MRALVDHAPALAPDLKFLLLKHPGYEGSLSEAPNVTEHVVRIGPNNPASMLFLRDLAPVAECDVFHSPSNILPARLGIKTVTTVHDIMWLTHPDWCETGWKVPFKRAFYGFGLRRALAHSDRIATVSEATRNEIAAYAPQSASRLTVTRSGVSERFGPSGADADAPVLPGLPPGSPFALIVGQNAPYKNHERALRAFAAALGSNGDAHAVFVQRQGEGASSLAAISNELGIADRVHFSGSVDEATLIQLYRSARVLLHPSLCEGFGNPVAEAMACGLPVITSDRSAMPEVAGGAARLVDPDDTASISAALIELWSDDAAQARMRKAGLARARELDWADFAAANVAIYRELLASG